MKWIFLSSAVLLAALLLHRLLLWMEGRGWIYYKRDRPSRTALGHAFLEIQSILEPDKKHVIEARDEMRKATEQAGDDSEEEDGDEAK